MIPPLASDSSIATTSILIDRCNDGDSSAQEALIQKFYKDLRRIASAHLRSERACHTLQPTALVHEAYFRLINQSDNHLKDKVHFFALASQLMRQILVDHARARVAAKRGGVQRPVTLTDAVFSDPSHSLDVLVLDQALSRLSVLDNRQARLVELHFFGGLSFDEIALVLSVSTRTVKRDWAMARAWLRNQLTDHP